MVNSGVDLDAGFWWMAVLQFPQGKKNRNNMTNMTLKTQFSRIPRFGCLLACKDRLVFANYQLTDSGYSA
jgi:hypothetical protein